MVATLDQAGATMLADRLEPGDVICTPSSTLEVETVTRPRGEGRVVRVNGTYDFKPGTPLMVLRGPGADAFRARLEEKADLARRERAEEVARAEAKAARETAVAREVAPGRADAPRRTSASGRPITERQEAFLRRFVPEVMAAGATVKLDADGILADARASADPRGTLSRYLDVLAERKREAEAAGAAKPAPKEAAASAYQPMADVPAGRFAIELDGALKFYRVKEAKNGRKYVSAVSGGPGAFRYFNVSADTARRVRELIAVDAEAALVRFGHEVGACGVCGSPLTDPESRARGIGPVCATKGF